MNLLELFWLYTWLIILGNMGVALYGLIIRPNILKKIACLTIMADTSFVIMGLIGYRFIYPVKPYILTNWTPTNTTIKNLLGETVDPLTPTLTITAVVINLAITILLFFLALRAYSIYGTLDVREIARLKREEE